MNEFTKDEYRIAASVCAYLEGYITTADRLSPLLRELAELRVTLPKLIRRYRATIVWIEERNEGLARFISLLVVIVRTPRQYLHWFFPRQILPTNLSAFSLRWQGLQRLSELRVLPAAICLDPGMRLMSRALMRSEKTWSDLHRHLFRSWIIQALAKRKIYANWILREEPAFIHVPHGREKDDKGVISYLFQLPRLRFLSYFNDDYEWHVVAHHKNIFLILEGKFPFTRVTNRLETVHLADAAIAFTTTTVELTWAPEEMHSNLLDVLVPYSLKIHYGLKNGVATRLARLIHRSEFPDILKREATLSALDGE